MNTDYTELESIILPEIGRRLSEKRLEHVKGVAAMSAEICNVIGRPDLIRDTCAASLLHDITREEPEEAQLRLIKEFHLNVTDDDLLYPATLHQLTGAALARSLFPDIVNDRVYSAISNHCTGREAMTAAEKTVFLADYIETGRKYDSSIRIRNLFMSEKNLTSAVLAELEEMSAHLGERLNSRTRQALHYYKTIREERKMKKMSPEELALEIVKILDKKNASDIKLLRVGDKTVIADYFVLCTGDSGTQVKSYADEVEYELGKQGVEARHIEGFSEASWIVLDYSSVVVHAFYRQTRAFYGLEKVWADAEEVDISSLITEK